MSRKRAVLALTLFSLTLVGVGIAFREELAKRFQGNATAAHQDHDSSAFLLSTWASASPEQRLDLAPAVVALFADPDETVRKLAVLAAGPAGDGEAVVSDEAFFPLLSDPDRDVRTVAAAVLGTRGLDDNQIALARKLAHRDAAERLSLLFDLRWANDNVKDPGPWLTRLAKDADPAVRAGAARAAFECRCSSADWVNDLADRDPDPLVRQIAGHYRPRQSDVRQTGGVRD